MSIFFVRHPALIPAIAVCIGTEACLLKEPLYLFFLSPLLFLSPYAIGWALTAFYLTQSSIYLPAIPESGAIGKATIHIEHLNFKREKYRSSWAYRGTLKSFEGEDVKLKGVPFFLSLPEKLKGPRPLANCDYEIFCHIGKGKGNQVLIKPLSIWIAKDQFSLSEWRFLMKTGVKTWIEKHFSSSTTIHLLSGLITGEFEDRHLRQDFGRFGLLHLLAISGFHFSILSKLLELLLRPFFHPRGLTFAMLILLSLYFVFLGWGPSLLRAWITLLLYLGAYFHEKFSSPLNSLGIALLFSVLLDPLLLESLGFQFSFLTTGAILLGLQPFLSLLDRSFPKRSFDTVLKWPWQNQISYILLGWIKEGVALSFATTCIAWPLTIYYFGTFPLLSLVYNIFFPFLVSISMSLLLFGTLISLISPLARAIHLINDYFTSFILNMTYDIPKSWDYMIQHPQLKTRELILYLIVIFFLFIYSQKQKKRIEYNEL